MADLTDEQAAIYDRQIRVWGADVQKHLMEANVLLMGCTALAAEVAKNFVLAGVGKLSVMDDTLGSRAPLTFLHNAKIVSAGQSVAAMFAAGLQELNPMVKVQPVDGSAHSLPDAAFVNQFQLVLTFGLHASEQQRLNDLCRSQDVSLIAARSHGGRATAFVDLISHKCKRTPDTDDQEAEKLVTLPYAPLATAAAVPWTSLARADQRQLNPLLPVWAAVTAFELEHDRAATAADAATINAAGEARAEGMKAGTWQEGVLREVLAPAAPMPAVDAVVGGFLGNDVVRIVSHVGVPTHNVLLFSVADNVVQVHNMTGQPSPLRS